MWVAFFFPNNAAVADATGILKNHGVTKPTHTKKHNLNSYEALSELIQNYMIIAEFWITKQVMLKTCLVVCVIKRKSWLSLISTAEKKQKAEPEAAFLKGVFWCVLNTVQTLT